MVVTIYNNPELIKTIMSQAFNQSILSKFQKSDIIILFNTELFTEDYFYDFYHGKRFTSRAKVNKSTSSFRNWVCYLLLKGPSHFAKNPANDCFIPELYDFRRHCKRRKIYSCQLWAIQKLQQVANGLTFPVYSE